MVAFFSVQFETLDKDQLVNIKTDMMAKMSLGEMLLSEVELKVVQSE